MECEDNSKFVLRVDIARWTVTAINHWLQWFIVEVRKGNGEHYCQDSLHQICCGLQIAFRAAGNTDINVFDGKEFAPFRELLDSEVKSLNSTGTYVYKRKLK